MRISEKNAMVTAEIEWNDTVSNSLLFLPNCLPFFVSPFYLLPILPFIPFLEAHMPEHSTTLNEHSLTSTDLQNIYDNAPIGIFTSTPEGRYIFANPAMARMYGYDSPQDLLASITDIARQVYVDPADRFQLYQMLENTESARNYESLHKRKDGSTFWTLESTHLVRNTDGSPRLVHGFVADISQQKRVQEKQCRQLLQTKTSLPVDGPVEQDQKIELKNIIDPSTIQQLMNDFFGLTGIGGALLDLRGNVLASTGWEDICFKFHRAHQETRRNCMESDSILSQGVEPGQCKIYQCKNNMLDIVMPIMVKGRHLGNLFTGQFFFTDNPPDSDIFKAQARQYGFDEEEYLAALRRVPLLDKGVVTKALRFYVKLAEIISTAGYNNLSLESHLVEREGLIQALRESEEKHRRLFETMAQGVIYQAADGGGAIITANPSAERILGLTFDQMRGKTSLDPHWKMIKEDGSDVAGTDHPAMIALRTGKTVGPVIRGIFHPDTNTHVWLSITAIPLFHPGETKPYQAYATFEDVTERNQAEEALRRSESLFRKVHEILPIGLWIADRNGKLLQGNPAGVAIWGAEPTVAQQEYGVFRARRLPSGDEIAPDDWALAHTVNNGETIVDELLEIEAFDGKKKTILNYTAPVLNDQGEVEAAIIVNQDITSRYQAEEALRESEERFRLSMEASNDGVWDWDIQTNQVYYSPGYARMLGYASTDIPAHVNSWLDLIHPEDRENAFKRNLDCIENRIASFTVEFRMQSRDGTWKWIMGRGRAVSRDAAGRAMRMIGTHADITERKLTEEALLESEEMQRKLLQSVPDLIVRTDLEGTISFVNEMAFPGLEHLPEESFYGRNIISFIVEHDRPRAMENARARLEKDIGPQEYQLCLDEAIVDAEVNGAVIRDKESRPVGLVYVIRDVTERRRAEQEQEKLQSLFLQAQKMESVGTLAGGVAHDFNNLLQVVRGNIELLAQQASLGSQAQSRVQVVIKTLDRATMLVQQLLLFSRKAESCKVQIDLNHELREAARMLERTIPKMIALELRLDSNAWPLVADSLQVEQALLNLTNNAVDAMPDGGKLIIETANVELDADFVARHPGSNVGRHVLLTVTDKGCGMDKATLRHVFDPFFTTKEVGKGTGLGLASVYGIVKAHGGYIQCSSEPGEGTTFKVFWPAVQGGEDRTEHRSQEPSLEGGSEGILVVDDDAQIRELTQEALEMLGYSVRMAVNGEQALEVYQDQAPTIDLVVLDLNMPGMGGYRCLKELLQFDPAVKIVIASGYSANGQGKAPLTSGAKGFLGKPYQLKELAAMVRCVLDGKEAGPVPE